VRRQANKSFVAWLVVMPPKQHAAFLGHIPAAVPIKTKDTIEADKKRRDAKLAGKTLFKAGANPKKPVLATATRCGKHGFEPLKEEAAVPPTLHAVRNIYNQEIDEATKRPLIDSVLSWNFGRGDVQKADNHTGLRVYRRKFETSDDQHGDFFDAHNVRAVRQDLEALTPRHRTALVRQIVMANPKFTAETRIARRHEHWDPMTQLLAHAFQPNPEDMQAGHNRSASARGNVTARGGVRIVAAYRSKRAASLVNRPRAWH
jgi:hypothetical protein